MIKTILLLLALIAFLIFIYGVQRAKNYQWFQNNMKPGDMCKFYINEVKAFGVIDDIMNDGTVFIDSEYGRMVKNKSDLYPKI